jgi:hypothetical protein
MESTFNQSTSKGNDNNIFLILIILIVAILWFTGSLNPRKERFGNREVSGMEFGWKGDWFTRGGGGYGTMNWDGRNIFLILR